MVLSSTLPSVGAGALKNREDPKVLGTSKVLGSLHVVLPDLLTTYMAWVAGIWSVTSRFAVL